MQRGAYHNLTIEGCDKEHGIVKKEKRSEQKEKVSTPFDTNISLNPGHDEAPKNPLCPVCEEQIRPIKNNTERRFVCGCKKIWQFKFDELEENNK